MADDTYQGWTNRETWLIALWLNNERGLQEHAQAVCNTDGEMIHEAAKSLEDFVDDELITAEGFQLDLINAALFRVNWVEVAQSFREGDQ